VTYQEWLAAGNPPAAWEAERQRLNALTHARWDAEAAARAAANPPPVPAEYLDRFPPMRRAKVKAALLNVIRLNGRPVQRWQVAEKFAAEGFRVDVDRGRIYHGAGGGFYALDSVISRTAVDYAQWLADRPAAKIPAGRR
jgi:hypothetical protein